jgi:hypothetical protein
MPDSNCFDCNCEMKYSNNKNLMNKFVSCSKNKFKFSIFGEILFCISGFSLLTILNKKIYINI